MILDAITMQTVVGVVVSAGTMMTLDYWLYHRELRRVREENDRLSSLSITLNKHIDTLTLQHGELYFENEKLREEVASLKDEQQSKNFDEALADMLKYLPDNMKGVHK